MIHFLFGMIFFSKRAWTMWPVPCFCEMGKLWEVIGGAEKGGILVRQGADCWAGDFWNGRRYLHVLTMELSIKKHIEMAVFSKNPIEFHANCDEITIWYCALPYSMFEHKHVYCMVFWTCPHTMCGLGTALLVALLCALCSQNCVQVFNLWFALICNISISVHVATEFRWFIEHAGVAIKLVSKNWLFIDWKYTTFTLQSCNHDESQCTLFFLGVIFT